MDLMAALKASVEATRQGKKPAAAKPASRSAKVKVAAKASAVRPAARRRTA
jgi:non-homologous end joining protein Ku